MTARGVWEEQLWASNAELPKRPMPDDHPIRGLPRQYIAEDLVLQPWGFVRLAPVEREWEPLPEHHEAVYLVRNSKLRHALVDYENGTVVAWSLTAGSTPYQSRSKPSSPEGTPH